MKILKWLIYSTLGLMLLLVLSLELFYQYKVYELKPQQVQSEQQHSLTAKEILWVELSEQGEIELQRTTATEYTLKFFSAVFVPITAKRVGTISIKGLKLASMTSRHIALKDQESGGQSRFHLNQLVRSIWLTRNSSADDLMGFALENLYFGERAYGIDKAAKQFFNKSENDLTSDELISLISLLKAPSRYHPIRNPKRHKSRAEYIARGLKENWPEKYRDYKFEIPTFTVKTAQ